jgi:hypothetical protein
MIGTPPIFSFFQAGLLISPAIANCLGVFRHDVVFSPFISGFTWFCIYQGFPQLITIVLINMISLLVEAVACLLHSVGKSKGDDATCSHATTTII